MMRDCMLSRVGLLCMVLDMMDDNQPVVDSNS